MIPGELREAAEALVERTTRDQALPRLVSDTHLLSRAAAMLTPIPNPRYKRKAPPAIGTPGGAVVEEGTTNARRSTS